MWKEFRQPIEQFRAGEPKERPEVIVAGGLSLDR
jgi:hypothetical protein